MLVMVLNEKLHKTYEREFPGLDIFWTASSFSRLHIKTPYINLHSREWTSCSKYIQYFEKPMVFYAVKSPSDTLIFCSEKLINSCLVKSVFIPLIVLTISCFEIVVENLSLKSLISTI